MSETLDTAREVYISGLRNQHAVENQAIELLERQLGDRRTIRRWLSGCGNIWRKVNSRQTESRVIGRAEHEPFDLEGHGDLVHRQFAALGHASASDEVIKNTFANYAFEHYEIASYQSLLVVADVAGQRDQYRCCSSL